MGKITSKEDIYKIESFNLDLLKEAIRQTELKVADENNRKERIDRKIYFLLPFTLFCLYFLMREIYFLPNDVVFKDYISNVLILSCSILLIVIGMLLYLLMPQSYGSLGKLPRVWLDSHIIEKGNDNSFGKVLTKILLDYDKSILQSYESNNKKQNILKYAMLLLSLFSLPLVLSITLHLF
jgi:hypothetical protein